MVPDNQAYNGLVPLVCFHCIFGQYAHLSPLASGGRETALAKVCHPTMVSRNRTIQVYSNMVSDSDLQELQTVACPNTILKSLNHVLMSELQRSAFDVCIKALGSCLSTLLLKHT